MSMVLSIASLIVAGASLIIAGATFRFTVLRVRREQHDRERQFGLMQEQIDAPKQADVSAELLGVRFANDGGDDEYDIRITNGGPAVARQVQVWVQAGDGLHGLSTDSLPALPPMQPGEHHSLTISAHPKLRYSQQQVQLGGSWRDESGYRSEMLHPLG